MGSCPKHSHSSRGSGLATELVQSGTAPLPQGFVVNSEKGPVELKKEGGPGGLFAFLAQVFASLPQISHVLFRDL